MYNNVSASFKEAFKSTYQQRYLKMEFTYINASGGTVTEELTQENLVSGSFSISSSALPASTFELGGVVSSELNFTLWNAEKQYSGAKFKGARIRPFMGIKTQNGIEYAPLGVFFVDECGKSYGKTIYISAVDGLMLFEKAIDYSLITFPCNMQYLFELACSTCGITISDDSEQMPTNITTIESFSDASITWRDVISACATAAAGFAKMNRVGELEIKTFIKSSDNTHTISYNGMRMGLETDEAITISGVAYYADAENYLLGEADYPIIVDSNPVFNAMSINSTLNFRTNICNLYRNMTYYPFSLEFAGDPTVDVGDWVLLDNTDEGDIYSLITEQILRFETKSKLEAVGVSELDKSFFDKNKAPKPESSGSSQPQGDSSGEVKPNLLQRSIILPGFEYADLDLFGQTTAGNVLGTVGSDVLAKCIWGLSETTWCWKTPYLILNLGSTYTLSFLVRNAVANGGTIKCAFVQNYNDAYPTKQSAYYKIIGEITTTPSTTAGFEWVSITFNTSDWIPDGSSASVAYKITTRFLKIFVKGCNIYKAKLEMGDKRTAWCLNNQEQLTYNNSYAQSIPALFASKIASNLISADDFNIDLAVDHPSQYEALYYRYQIGLIEYIYKNGTMTKVDITALSGSGSGESYTLTDEDKAEIADAVIAQIGEVGGIAGPKGTTFTPNVSADGVISWTNDGGLANPSPVNIMGPTGPQGPAGADGSNYVLTDADKEEIAEIVLANIEIPEGGSSGTTTTYAAKLANIAKENNCSKWMIAGDAVLMFISDYEYTVYKNKNNTPTAIAAIDTLYTYINRICLNESIITALTNDEYSEVDTAYIVDVENEEYTTETYSLNETDSMDFGEELTDYNYDMTAEAFEAAGL